MSSLPVAKQGVGTDLVPTPSPVSPRDRIRQFQAVIAAMPEQGIPLFDGFKTTHYFANGMYGRAVWRPKGVTTVGKLHKHEHFSILLSGTVAISDGEKSTIYRAGDVFVSKPGTKRSVHALTDAVFMTIHRLPEDTRDLDSIEEQLIEPEEDLPRLFDSNNKVIDPALTMAPGTLIEGPQP